MLGLLEAVIRMLGRIHDVATFLRGLHPVRHDQHPNFNCRDSLQQILPLGIQAILH